ncbi:MAG: Hsp20/alpha crystallin family protein [Candidatus Bathyarchaeota archaeon]|nr:Hsp20/alpha crystallin family protein [Candidatus Bathyarchaeota archaeon]
MSDEDWWSRWLRKGRRPYPRSGFGDIDEFFKEIEEMMEREISRFSERAPGEYVQERTLPDGTKVKRWGPFIYGYSVTFGQDGKPQVREFGNLKPETRRGRPRVNIREMREPLVDVLETDGEVKVIAELPGVEKKDIKLHGDKKTLTISVDTPQRKYNKEVRLPTTIDTKAAKSTYNNGVLEVTLPKRKEEARRGEPIRID